ncbi:MAG: hypothetical protein JOZ10_01160 [Acidobacteria bacterium]|nr:hypothetical protein [Acidobacteriota bacterium]MBV9434521.1 hypothetical protein [Acidobacteriota bacterium]
MTVRLSSPTLPVVTILIVCADEGRREQLKTAIHSAGFRTISANGLDAAWTRTDYFDFGAVVLDHEFRDDVAASAFRQRYITLGFDEECRPETLAIELANLFHRASELVQ